MDAASTSHMIRFGSLTFRPVKGKNQLFCSLFRFIFYTAILKWKQVTWSPRMIFHSIKILNDSADQNARIRFFPPKSDRQSEARRLG